MVDYPVDAVGENDDDDDALVEEVEDRSFFDMMANTPNALYEAATGEGVEVEFPDIPESTEIEDIGFFESIAPNLKAMIARDDTGKAEILQNSFRGDERFGGVFSDKYNHPMVVWNDKPYYINKPGFSGQDLGTFIGEIAKYSPATKYVSKAQRLLSTIKRGVPTYAATEIASEAGESLLAPKAARARTTSIPEMAQDAATATAVGVAADVVVPGVLKPAARVARRGLQATGEAAKSIFPRYTATIDQLTPSTPAPLSKSKYPLTVGQRSAQFSERSPEEVVTRELQNEDMIRRAPGTDEEAAKILRGFDQSQLDQIRIDAEKLRREFGSGDASITSAIFPGDAAAEEIQNIATVRAKNIKAAAGKAYDAVELADPQPIFSREGVVQTAKEAINSVTTGELKMTAREIASMPVLARELDFLKRLGKLALNPKFKGQPLTMLSGYQKTLNRAFRQAEKGSPEQLALGKVKGVVDNSVFDGIEQGFITGDQAILDQLKSATDLYRQYIGLAGKGAGRDAPEQAANKILQMVTNQNYTPVQVSRAIIGHAKFNPNQSMGLVIDKLKAGLPEDEAAQVIALIKDGILEQAFSGKGKFGVTRTNIVNNFDDVFVKQKLIINKLFPPEEIARIKQFRDNVLPTMWAEIKLNPSGTSYAMLGALADKQILNYVKLIPFGLGQGIAEGAKGMVRTGQADQALDAIRQYKARSTRPLFTAPFSAAVRPPIIHDEAEASAVLPLATSMSSAAKQKVMQAAQQ